MRVCEELKNDVFGKEYRIVMRQFKNFLAAQMGMLFPCGESHETRQVA